jgi:hypothetical protein
MSLAIFPALIPFSFLLYDITWGQKAVQITQRAQALTVLEVILPFKYITEKTKLDRRTVFRIRKRAIERGYDPDMNPAFQDSFFTGKPRRGRPTLLGPRELRIKEIFLIERL